MPIITAGFSHDLAAVSACVPAGYRESLRVSIDTSPTSEPLLTPHPLSWKGLRDLIISHHQVKPNPTLYSLQLMHHRFQSGYFMFQKAVHLGFWYSLASKKAVFHWT